MSEMTEAELRDLQERWLAFQAAVEGTWAVVAEILGPVFEEVRRMAVHLIDTMRRAYLCQLLPQWMPRVIRIWLTRHWPKALLPDLTEAIEWVKAEAVER